MKKMIVNYQKDHRGTISEAIGDERRGGCKYTLSVQRRTRLGFWQTVVKRSLGIWSISHLEGELDELWDDYIFEYERKLQIREAFDR